MRFNGEVLTVAIASILSGCGGSSTGQASAKPADAGLEAPEVAADHAESEAAPPVDSPFQLIDDMDHADGTLPMPPPGSAAFFWPSPVPRGIGNWFLSSPGVKIHDAPPDSIEPPRGESKKACHVSGANLERGADLWAQLDHPSGRPVDLSAYSGIAFWARLVSPSGRLVVALGDQVGRDYFTAEGSQAPLPSRPLALSDKWQQFFLPFHDFGVDAPAVSSIDFVVGGGGESFDLWIDDLALSCRGACP